MKSILKKIVKKKKAEVRKSKQKLPLKQIKKRAADSRILIRDFHAALKSSSKVGLIGEVKKASPSKGIIRKRLDIQKTALVYEQNGVCAISVLTDSHFKGNLSDLVKVSEKVNIPVLRKDFLIDVYQIYEAYLAGADAVLLIAAILSAKKLSEMLDLVHSLGMNAIVEIHTEDELKKIDFRKARIIGINNRDLDTFDVELCTTEKLIRKIPKSKTVISESGVFSRKDILFLQKLKVNAVLVGEGIVRSTDIGLQVRKLLGRK